MTGPVYSQEIRDQAIALHKEGVATRAIARQLGIGSDRTVRGWINGTSGTSRKTKKDRVGEQVGSLVVKKEVPIHLVPESKSGKRPSARQTYWLLACKLCCREKIWAGDSITQLRRRIERGSASSGGCNWCELGTATDYTGQIVGAWKAIRWRKVPNTMPSVNSETLVEWFCRCTICNESERWVRAAQLSLIQCGQLTNKSDEGVGCGCNTKPLRDSYRLHGRELMEWYYSVKRRAKKENLAFDLEPSDLADIPDQCPVLGIPLLKQKIDRLGATDNAPSVDKFIPELGCVKSNIHIISYRANRLKNDGTPEEWQKIAAWCQKEEVKRKMRQPDF